MIGDGRITIPLTQAFPTTRVVHQMDAPPDGIDGLSPLTVTVAFLYFVDANGKPVSISNIGMTAPPPLQPISLAPDDPNDLTVWRLRLWSGDASRVYQLVLLCDQLYVVNLSLVLHRPVTSRPLYANNLVFREGDTNYTAATSDGKILQSVYPL